MIKLIDKTNVDPVSVDWPLGKVRDDSAPGVLDGTALDFRYHTDYAQFFEYMFSKSGIIANGNPDNEANGWQLYEAFRKLTKPYKSYTALANQVSTGAPDLTVLGFNEIGAIVWTRSGAGEYVGTLAGAFPAATTFVPVGGGVPGAQEYFIRRITDNEIQIQTRNGGNLGDNVLVNSPIEIRVYDPE